MVNLECDDLSTTGFVPCLLVLSLGANGLKNAGYCTYASYYSIVRGTLCCRFFIPYQL